MEELFHGFLPPYENSDPACQNYHENEMEHYIKLEFTYIEKVTQNVKIVQVLPLLKSTTIFLMVIGLAHIE